MRIGIIASKAVSLVNIAKDIAYVAMRRGHAPRITTYIDAPVSIAKMSDCAILVYPASPLFCAEYMLLYRELKVNHGVPCVYYTMIEGRPRKCHIAPWMIRDVEFVACSNYVREKLSEMGFRVLDVVPHGLVKEVLREAERLVPIARQNLKRLHGDKIIFGVVSHSHVRKGLQALARAINHLSERRKDFVVHIVTNPETKRKLQGVPNVYIDTVFGTRSREEILAFLGAIDFLVIPSFAEGFCLPLLEANAMGTIAIHCAYPPLTEISDLERNLSFSYEKIEFVNTGEGVEYELHIYDARVLADFMDYAIDIKTNYPSDYEDRKEKLKAVREKFDAEKLYGKLLAMVGA